MNLHLSFHTILILAYTVPNIYLFLRILNLFIAKRFRLLYVIIYFVIVLVYPASNIISECIADTLRLSDITYYLLPFCLYLFLLTLISDLLLLVNWLFKIIPAEKLKSFQIRKISFLSILMGIPARYGVYAVLGNHEYYAGQVKGNFFDEAGMKVLRDIIVVVDSLFSLAGRYDSHFAGRKPVYDLINSAPDSLPLILIDHRPTEIKQVSSTKTDIQLSGHIHNGQLFPINFITRKVYELSWGHMKKGNTDFFVTRGIRLWGPPVRTTGKSEIMVVDINYL